MLSGAAWVLLVVTALWTGLWWLWITRSDERDHGPWLALIRDERLRHLAAAHVALGEFGDGRGTLAEARAQVAAAEELGATDALTALTRLRVDLATWAEEDVGHPPGPLPSATREAVLRDVAALRRADPANPLCDLLDGCVYALDGRTEDAAARLRAVTEAETPVTIPVLPAPWRWLAALADLPDPLITTWLVPQANRRLAQEAAACALRGEGERAERLLSLLADLGLALGRLERCATYPRTADAATEPQWTMTGYATFVARSKALAHLAAQDPETYGAAAETSAWQAEVAGALCHRAVDRISLETLFLWIGIAWFAIGLRALEPLVRVPVEAVMSRLTRRREDVVDLAASIPGRAAVGALVALGLAAGLFVGLVWNRLYLAETPSNTKALCWAAVGALWFVAFVPAFAHSRSHTRLRRAARAAGDGIWQRRIRRPVVARMFGGSGGVALVVVAVSILSLVATAAWPEVRGEGRTLSALVWALPGTLVLRGEDFTSRERPIAESVMQRVGRAGNLAEAKARTPVGMAEGVEAGYRERIDRYDPDSGFARGVQCLLDGQR